MATLPWLDGMSVETAMLEDLAPALTERMHQAIGSDDIVLHRFVAYIKHRGTDASSSSLLDRGQPGHHLQR